MRAPLLALSLSFLGFALACGGGGSPGGPGSAGGGPGNGGSLDGFSIFPADNPWNTDISSAPVDPASPALIASIGSATGLHPDFGTSWQGAPIGIPYVLVPADQPKVQVVFDYAGESDPGPYPIPADAPVEGGPASQGDRHVLVLDLAAARLYELYDAFPVAGGASWTAGSGAIFDLTSNALRPARWTSADAAGLPIFPGLVRYDEAVEAGAIHHALRFTVQRTRQAYVPPARHWASSSTSQALPPMGMRVRLKASVAIAGYPPHVQAILLALQHYGMFVADNGSNWYLSGTHDSRWNDEELSALGGIKGSDFEVVQMTGLQTPP